MPVKRYVVDVTFVWEKEHARRDGPPHMIEGILIYAENERQTRAAVEFLPFAELDGQPIRAGWTPKIKTVRVRLGVNFGREFKEQVTIERMDRDWKIEAKTFSAGQLIEDGKMDLYELIVTYMPITLEQARSGNLPADPDVMQSGGAPDVAKTIQVDMYAHSEGEAITAAEYLPFSAMEGGDLPGFAPVDPLICVLSIEAEKLLDAPYTMTNVEVWGEWTQIDKRVFSARQLIKGDGGDIPPADPKLVYAVEITGRFQGQGIRVPVTLIAAETGERAMAAATEAPLGAMVPVKQDWEIDEVRMIRHPFPIASESVRAIEGKKMDWNAENKIFSARQLLGERLPTIDNMPAWALGEHAAAHLALLRSRFADGPNDYSADDVIFALSPHEALRHVMLELGVAGIDPEMMVDAVDAIIYPGGRDDSARSAEKSGGVLTGRIVGFSVDRPGGQGILSDHLGETWAAPVEEKAIVDLQIAIDSFTISYAGAMGDAALGGKRVQLIVNDGGSEKGGGDADQDIPFRDGGASTDISIKLPDNFREMLAAMDRADENLKRITARAANEMAEKYLEGLKQVRDENG